MLPYPNRQKLIARKLRSDQTDAEARLWRQLRARQLAGAKFRRQHPVGPYIADFCCVEERLIIEVDGGQHSEQAKKELSRTDFLRRSGYRVVRFWNNDVLMNLEAVLDRAH